MVTLYSGPACQQCKLTEKVLGEEGIEYRKIDLSLDEEAKEYVKSQLGLQGVPVIEAPNGVVFQGFNPDRLRKLAAQ